MPTTLQQQNKMEQSKTKDYANRIFGQLVILVAAPLLLVGVLSGFSYYKGQVERTDMALSAARLNAQTQIESVLDRMRTYYLSVTKDDQYDWLQNEMAPPYADYINLKASQSLLRGGDYMAEYVTGYEYLNLKGGWVLNNNGMFRLALCENRDAVQSFLSAQEDTYSSVYWSNTADAQVPATTNKTVNLAGQMLVVRTTSTLHGTTGVVLVHLNTSRLSRMLSSWQEMGYRIVITDYHGTPLLPQDAELAEVLRDLNMHSDQTAVVQKWRVAGGASSANGMYYYALTAANTPLIEGGVTLLISLGVLALMIAMLLFCRWTSAFLYRPIGALLNTVNGVFGQREIGQDEFAYLTSGVNRLAADQQTLQSMVVLQKGELKEQFMLHMLRSEITLDAIKNTLQEFEAQPCHSYRLLCVLLDTPPGTTGPERQALARMVLRQFPRELRARMFLCPVVMDMVIVMVAGDKEDAAVGAAAQTMFKATAKIAHNYFGHTCRGGLSQPFHTLAHMRTAYNEALEALRSRGTAAVPPPGPGGQPHLQGEAAGQTAPALNPYVPADTERAKNGYDVLLENEVIAAVTACNKKEAKRLLDAFVLRLEEKQIRGYERQFYIQRLVAAILSVAENAGLSVNQVLSEREIGLFEAIGKIYTTERMQAFLLEEVAAPVMELLTNYRRDTSSTLVKDVVALIKQTKGDITLNECAERLNYHPSYIWKMLKAERDVNFTDLVNAQKLEMAKELLLTTDLTVAQVAETLHYANVQNFIRFFSKEVGTTPGKYKKEYQAGKRNSKSK